MNRNELIPKRKDMMETGQNALAQLAAVLKLMSERPAANTPASDRSGARNSSTPAGPSAATSNPVSRFTRRAWRYLISILRGIELSAPIMSGMWRGGQSCGAANATRRMQAKGSLF
jgi:hypothetical protein